MISAWLEWSISLPAASYLVDDWPCSIGFGGSLISTGESLRLFAGELGGVLAGELSRELAGELVLDVAGEAGGLGGAVCR